MSPPRFALLVARVLLAAYFWGNSQPEVVRLVPPPWTKLAHLTWYAILAGLLLLGLGRRAWPWVLASTLLLAGWDEWVCPAGLAYPNSYHHTQLLRGGNACMSENRLPDYLDHIRQAAEDACSFVDGLGKEDFLADKRTQAQLSGALS